MSEKAIETAQKNAYKHDSNVVFQQQDIFEANSTTFSNLDIIVSNPPYVRESEKEEMHQNVLKYEPHLALFVEDADPLIFYRKIRYYSVKSRRGSHSLFRDETTN